jgi:hypothetical protein
MNWLQTFLIIVILAALCASVYFSFRYRTMKSPKGRGLNAANMNISMGIMLIAISGVQLLLFTGSTLRVIVGLVMFLLGLFNLFAGIRNRSVYVRMKEQSPAASPNSKPQGK